MALDRKKFAHPALSKVKLLVARGKKNIFSTIVDMTMNDHSVSKIQYLFIELHKRASQLVRFPCAGPGCLAAKAVLKNWLQVCWVDSL